MSRRAAALGLCAWLALGCGATPPAPGPASVVSPHERAPTPSTPSPSDSLPASNTLAPSHVRKATPEEQQVVAQLAREAERIRGLTFRAQVAVIVQDASAMKKFVEEQIDDAELELARQRYVLLRMLDPALDIRPLLLDLMEEQLIGYYDPEAGSLAVRADVADSLRRPRDAQELMTLRAVILHELVHALQDQHFDLEAQLGRKRTTDGSEAFDALVEGDATLAMVAYVAESAGVDLKTLLATPDLTQQMLGPGMNAGHSQLDKAPAIVREPLLFAYRDGARYVAQLARHGGWDRVNAAHRTPPTSTGEILWPDRHPGDPLVVSAPDTLEEPRLRVVEEEVLGPYELGLFLAEMGGDAGVAKAWSADRLWQLRLDGAPALAWVIAFAQRPVARRTEALLAQQPSFQVSRSGNRVILLVGVPEPLAERLVHLLSGG